MDDFCDDCGKPLDECPMWKEAMRVKKGIEDGTIETRTCTLEEYLKELEEEE